MTKVVMSTNSSAASSHPKITLDDLRRRWGKFDEAELAAIRTNADLVMQIQTKYGLDAQRAQANVDLWAKGREL